MQERNKGKKKLCSVTIVLFSKNVNCPTSVSSTVSQSISDMHGMREGVITAVELAKSFTEKVYISLFLCIGPFSVYSFLEVFRILHFVGYLNRH